MIQIWHKMINNTAHIWYIITLYSLHYMIYTWYIHDTNMIHHKAHTWYLHYMIYTWYIYGTYMIHNDMIQTWYKHDSEMIHTWYIHCTHDTHKQLKLQSLHFTKKLQKSNNLKVFLIHSYWCSVWQCFVLMCILYVLLLR